MGGQSRTNRRPISSAARLHRASLAAIEALEARIVLSTVVVNTFVDQVDVAGSKTVSLRDAIGLVEGRSGSNTVDIPAGQYDLTLGNLEIDTAGTLTLAGIGGTAVLNAQGQSRVLLIDPGSHVTGEHLSITGGGDGSNAEVSYGGGILNDGSLVLTNSQITGDLYGGIYNDGTLALSESTISGNDSEFGQNTIIIQNQGAMNLSGTTVSANVVNFGGEVIQNSGTLTMTDSTISGNTAFYNASDNGVLYNSGSATLTNDTIVGNTKGIDSTGTLSLANSVVAGNSLPAFVSYQSPLLQSDLVGSVKSLGGNFIGQTNVSSGWLASDHVGQIGAPLDPLLAPLGNYGGPTQTIVPLGGSPLLGAGAVNAVPAGVVVDQRGLPRIVHGKVDIGAVEIQQTSPLISIKAPPNQSVNSANSLDAALGSFTAPAGDGPFLVSVTWGDGAPDTTFSMTSAGAIPAQVHDYALGGNLTTDIAITDADGDLSNAAEFKVSVPAPIDFVVNTTSLQIDPPGSLTVSLTDAMSIIESRLGPAIISFDPKVFAAPTTLDLGDSSLEFDDIFGPVTIIGPAAGLTLTTDLSSPALLGIDSGATVNISGLTFTDPYGLAISNSGDLAFTGGTLSQSADGAISNDGTLVLQNSTITGNSTEGGGGALFNSGTASISGCTITGNATVTNQYGEGQEPRGAICNTGTLTLTNSTLSGNTSDGVGGGLYNTGSATVSDSTITNNSGYGGGIDNAQGIVTLANTIVAGNQALYYGNTGNDVLGAVKSLGHNLIGDTDGSSGWIASDLTGTAAKPLNPLLSPLGDWGGGTQTCFPLPGSRAINTGSIALIPAGIATDQRGYPRTSAGKLDIGAVQLQYAAVVSVTPPAKQSVVAGVATAIHLGSFTDPGGAGPFTVDVHWGDGSPDTQFTVAQPGPLQATHEFINTGALSGTITVRDALGDISNVARFAISSAAAPAVTVVVDTTKDQTDSAGSKTISLRDAIDRADASFGPVAITFDPIVFATEQIIALDGNELTLDDNRFGLITLAGPAAGVTVDGGGGSGDFLIQKGVSAALYRISLSGGSRADVGNGDSPADFEDGIENYGTVTVTNSAITGCSTVYGGGIFNAGEMVLADSTIDDNVASVGHAAGKGAGEPFGGYGGGIDNTGSMTVTGCTISGNSAASSGGGIYNSGQMSIFNTTISGNSCNEGTAITSDGKLSIADSTITQNGPAYDGLPQAAVENGQLGTMVITNSAIAQNASGGILNQGTLAASGITVAGNDGSGINSNALEGNPVTLTLTNSTISGNTGYGGAGIVNYGLSVGAKAVIDDCTIVGNAATYYGGGILNDDLSTLSIANTIVAGNSIGATATAHSPDVSGAINSLGHNLIGVTDGSSGWLSSDQTGTVAHPLNAKLSPLGNYGGPTQTMVPLAGSPALNAGSVALIPSGMATDQRGLPRVLNGKVDIGAVEVGQAGPFGGTPAAFGVVQAENFDYGGQGVGYYDPGNVNSGGLYRPTEGVGIGAIPAADGGGYFVGWTQPGETLNYTVTVAQTGTYTLNFRVSSDGPGGTFHLNVGGKNVTGELVVPDTGNWNTYDIVSKAGVKLTAGTYVVQLVIDSEKPAVGAAGNFDWFSAVKQ